LRELSTQLLTIQEEERKRIARELHDSIGQSLSAIKFGIDSLIAVSNQADIQIVQKPLTNLLPVIRTAMDETRRICLDLRPSMLDDLGITATLNWFFKQYQSIYPKIYLEYLLEMDEMEIPEHLKIILFRITQEALNNIAKYGEAELVNVSLSIQDGFIRWSVEDNGIGFDLEALTKYNGRGKGMGILGMRERVELSGGSFTIDSLVGEGTNLSAKWPVAIGTLVEDAKVISGEPETAPRARQ
jgi:signal transduction histidine kinase